MWFCPKSRFFRLESVSKMPSGKMEMRLLSKCLQTCAKSKIKKQIEKQKVENMTKIELLNQCYSLFTRIVNDNITAKSSW
eukprot:m.2581 g.2581  ORF g.2581 m.2581 type:complete len:80 (+) comp2548_c0_seq1:1452-1691(+)